MFNTIEIRVFEMDAEDELYGFQSRDVPSIGDSVFIAGGDEYVVKYVQWQLHESKHPVSNLHTLSCVNLICELA